MIGRTHRFHGYGSLRFVYKQGKTVRGPQFAVKYTNNPRRRTYRLAVVVSKKVNKSAVVRNRIRRRMYEIVRGLEVGISEPYDIVLTIFNDSVATVPAEELQQAVRQQFKQAGIIH